MDGHFIHEHSEVRIGDHALVQNVVKQCRGAGQHLLFLFADLVVPSALNDLVLQLNYLCFPLFDHVVVEFSSGFVRYLAHNQILDLLLKREDFIFVLPDLQFVSGLLLEPLLNNFFVSLALGYYPFTEILHLLEHQFVKLRLMYSVRSAVLFAYYSNSELESDEPKALDYETLMKKRKEYLEAELKKKKKG